MKHLIIILTCACLCFVSYLNGYRSGRESLPSMEDAIQAAYTLGKRDIIIKSLDYKPRKPNPGVVAAARQEDVALLAE